MTHKCYFNDCEVQVDEESDLFPFCSEDHHKLWAGKNTGTYKENGKRKLTIEQMQKELTRMSQETRTTLL